MKKGVNFRKKMTVRRILSGALTASLCLTLTPVASMAEMSDAGAADEDVQAKVSDLLAAGDYSDGEVLVLVRQENDGDVSLAAEDLLSGAEVLATIEAETYEEYCENTGESAEEEAVELADEASDPEILYVSDPSRSTGELLELLLQDDRVLAAEPNYITQIEDVTSQDEDLTVENTDETEEAAEDTDTAVDAEDEVQYEAEEESIDISEDADVVEMDESDAEKADMIEMDDEDSAKEASGQWFLADLSSDESVSLAGARCIENLTPYQWGYNNTGKMFNAVASSSEEDFDINPTGWNEYDGSLNPINNAEGVVCIMDSGVDYAHPDLDGVMIGNQGAYDEGMKYYNPKGGYYGFNAYDNDLSEPLDVHGHGTHCAGIVAAEWNGVGTSGAASGVKLCAVRVGSASGSVSTLAAVRGYQYLCDAMDKGLDLVAVNCSWGGPGSVGEMLGLMITKLGEKGAISCYSAGNATYDHDQISVISGALSTNPYVVVVDSASSDGSSAYYSDYGRYSTDIYAPGTNILSTSRTDTNVYSALVEMDSVIKEFFDDDDIGDVTFSLARNPSSQEEIVEKKTGAWNSDYGYEGSGCYAISVNDMRDEERGDIRCTAYLKILKNKLHSMDTLTFAMSTDAPVSEAGEAGISCSAGICVEDDVIEFEAVGLSDSSWRVTTLNMNDILEADQRLRLMNVDDTYAYLPLILNFETGEYEEGSDISVYVDTICMGSDIASYRFMSGTSMAAPAVSGAAAIVAKRQTEYRRNGDPGLWARERANILKGSVRTSEELADKCRSGGMLDLSLSEDEYVPVINRIEKNESGTIDIQGAYFGNEQGTLYINGNEQDTISEWKDDKIVIDGEAYNADTYQIEVDAANGKIGESQLTLVCSSPEARSNIFDGSIELPEVAASCGNVVMRGDGENLYCMFKDGNDDRYLNNLYVYNTENGFWMYRIELPFEEKPAAVSMAINAETLYIYASYRDTSISSYYYSKLYAYNYRADEEAEVTEISVENLPTMASLVCTEGKLYLTGGGYCVQAKINDPTKYTIPCRGTLWQILSEIDDRSDPIAVAKEIAEIELYEYDRVETVATDDGFYALWIDSKGSWGDFKLAKVTIHNNQASLEDMSSALPEVAKEYAVRREGALALSDEGLILTGLYSADEQGGVRNADTYILRDGAEQFEQLTTGDDPDGHVLKANANLFDAGSAFVMNNTLYVSGMSSKDPSGAFIHYTDMQGGKMQSVVFLDPYGFTDSYSGAPVDLPEQTGAIVKGSTGAVTFRYYADAACETLTTKSNSGALTTGSAPVNAGQYYVVASVAGDSNYYAADSEIRSLEIKKAASKVTLKAKTATYTGKAIAANTATVTGSKGAVTYKYYLDAACEKATTKSNSGASATGGAPVYAGTYYTKASVAADANYDKAVSAAAKLTISKAAPVIKVTTTAKSYKVSDLKTAAKTFSLGASVTGKGTMTYKISKYATANAKGILTVSKTTGKVTVKKGTPKGTYKINVTISAAASTNYKAATKTVTVTVKVV